MIFSWLLSRSVRYDNFKTFTRNTPVEVSRRISAAAVSITATAAPRPSSNDPDHPVTNASQPRTDGYSARQSDRRISDPLKNGHNEFTTTRTVGYADNTVPSDSAHHLEQKEEVST